MSAKAVPLLLSSCHTIQSYLISRSHHISSIMMMSFSIIVIVALIRGAMSQTRVPGCDYTCLSGENQSECCAVFGFHSIYGCERLYYNPYNPTVYCHGTSYRPSITDTCTSEKNSLVRQIKDLKEQKSTPRKSLSTTIASLANEKSEKRSIAKRSQKFRKAKSNF